MRNISNIILAVILLNSCATVKPPVTPVPPPHVPKVSIVAIPASQAQPVLITPTHSIANSREVAQQAAVEHKQLEQRIEAASEIQSPMLSAPPPEFIGSAAGSGNPMTEAAAKHGGHTLEPITIITREFIYSNKQFDKFPINVIIFPHKPITVTELSNYQFICEVWKANFPKTQEVTEQYSDPNSVVTVPMYWLAKQLIKTESCTEFVNNYDYVRAQYMVAKNKLDPAKVQILSILKSGVIVMDITSLTKETEIELAFSTWKRKMCFAPKKDTKLYVYDLYTSTKDVLGALGSLIAMK